MARIIILIALAAIGLILWHKITKTSGAERKKLMFWGVIGIAATIVGILAITGHLNVITAAIAGLVALLPRASQFLKYLPFVSRLLNKNNSANQQQTGHNQQSPPQRGKQTMSQDDAMDVLGLKTGYSKDDVKQAHRRMMLKNHPDRGGSDYLAAQINTAKDVLLG